jgi:hypothetical protein
VAEAGRVTRGRLLLTAAVLAYAVAFLFGYRVSVVDRFEYFGMGDRQLPAWGVTLLLVMAVVPSWLVPTRLVRPSQLLYWAMYLSVYIPSLFLLFFSNLPRLSMGLAAATAAALCAGVTILGLSYTVPARRFRAPRIEARSFTLVAALVAGLLYAYMLVSFGGMFRWVTFGDVGGQREAFFAAVGGTLGGYAFAWLVAVVNPVLVGVGFSTRRWWLMLAGLLGQVLMYGAAAAKGVLLSALVLPLLALLVARFRDRFSTILAGGLALFFTLTALADLAGLRVLGTAMTFVVLYRATAVPALATAQYAGFFAEHPHTWGSHITGLSSLITYPYPRSLDYLIGQHFYDRTELGLNASTWASDGIAGFGTGGILLASLICALVFWTLDAAADGLDLRFTVVALGYGVVNFSNVPLFTNLVTGGVALLIVLLYLWPRPAPPVPAPA